MIAFLSLFISGLFGLGGGQNAYLNVLVVPVPAAVNKAPALASAGICDITLSFFDGESNPINSNEVLINPGSSSTLALRRGNRGGGLFDTRRISAYGEVELMPDSDPSCQIVPSLDLTDSDGNTTVHVPLNGRPSPVLAPPPASK